MPPASPAFDDHEFLTWIRRAVDAHAIMAVTDASGAIVFANDRFCEISGYAREELLGKTHRLIKSDQHPPEFFAELWRTIGSGRVWRGTLCNRAKSGTLYWVESTILPIPGADGRPRCYLALRTDVTPLKEAEAGAERLVRELAERGGELRQAQEQLQVFFDHAPIGLSWREFGPDGQPGINHVNQRFCELIGLSLEESRDIENVRRATHPEDWAVQEALTAELYAGQRESFSLEKRYLHRNGRIVRGSLTVVVLRDPTGRPTHHFAMLEDVTARHAAEEQLRRAEARWRTYLETASEILYALTSEGVFKFVSPAWTEKLGHPTEHVVGHPFEEFLHPEDVALCRDFVRGILNSTTTSPAADSIEYRVRHHDGRWLWHASTGSAYIDRNGQRAFFGVGRDITMRRQAEEDLRAALARREELEKIVNRSPSVVVLWRAEEGWPVEFVSQSITQFGYTPEEFTSRKRNFTSITHPDDLERVLAEVSAHASAGHSEYNQEYRVVCADGSFRWVDDHTVVRRDADGGVTHHEGLLTDITSRHEAEERERATRERDLRLAGDIQQHLRPRVFPDISEVEIEALVASSMLIGGDYYDVLPVEARRWGFVVADVSGKGAGAALMMAECRATLRLCAAGASSPAEVLRRVNRSIQPDMRPGMFITLFYGILDLDTHVLRYCRAGHEPPLLLRRGATDAETLAAGGLALGLDEGSIFDEMIEEGQVTLNPGDLLALYTDGITEATNPASTEFGRDRLAAALQRHDDRPLAEVARTVDRYVRNFCVLAPRHDDRTLLLVRPR